MKMWSAVGVTREPGKPALKDPAIPWDLLQQSKLGVPVEIVVPWARGLLMIS